ncbi:hypothetical protein SARC_03356 [Sphaeroforma arctica JP610]|uniref:Uncharacterized protein n=1 Tax=Sphaeroforma arctica JP610 TaxID=667725 RepID=A0A0L0G851_9EUKA|nr:hypothetical protein SARC_03356 [Sphaeroforma arctica JP610]KNC84428.1 hypothetical protein SARC_03356 [Sphaeroforma arctica JP610]|eukprot:XP_014158330.1 hypothetical protein SARC_03356 [Sphaeroforma arctica JP610]
MSDNQDNSPPSPEPQIISGWEHSRYAHRDTERNAYKGKNDGGDPEWLDYGSKSARSGRN